MRRKWVSGCVVAAAYLGMGGCATGPPGDRARLMEIPLASLHADVSFTIASAYRQSVSCAGESACPPEAERSPALRFAEQVQRVAGVLQAGARQLYPDLAQRAPRLAASTFDVYVVEAAEAGSDSSANGRIALNSALGSWQPDDDWLAFVIAREMGHVIARHHEENSATSIAASAILTLVLPGSGLLKSALSMGGSRMAARSKRDVQAAEADAIALRLLEAAGFSRHQVALSLLIAPVSPDQGAWSRDFKKSTDHLLAEIHGSEFGLRDRISQAGSESPAESAIEATR